MDYGILLMQQILNGLHIGSIYALIALGYTMVYGIVKLINFAHGDIMMVGAYIAFMMITTFNLPLPIAIIISMASCALIGMGIEKVAYKPLRNAPRMWALITAIGVSFFLETLFTILFGASSKPFPTLSLAPIQIGALQISQIMMISIGLSVFLMIALELFIKKTKLGKAMRAASEDAKAAALMGISVNKTISIAFAIGSALGAIGGILFAMAYPQIKPLMGVMPGLKAFIAAVLGGIGILPGAMLGGFLLGIIESITKGFLSAFWPDASLWADAILFLILILVLLLKPAGILGKNVREKV
ncbi:MAG: branched-chain amino acid ABC transporter permease [Zhenhengia sp.]|jgi:branched-chain amino acid transport system permease protein|uniref:branched-chain amino acid ABC transporter permease n=1 Tax=Zhenhengia sp. TaxID=2944208 RepID=UPI00290BB537|nr:branched-chain amino acid ABC transporter permease [Clostridiales bacterium]MDU6360452.1 branched-chain amino acid ABC transporter permease [Clostridiales bacterium]MDU6853500.1 branched-chain amino acid ABC transporter permease [Clostridiales bacterium]MDU6973353.1 branched-chain amino acid ABC transporter permease [Clostridiales bacterium]